MQQAEFRRRARVKWVKFLAFCAVDEHCLHVFVHLFAVRANLLVLQAGFHQVEREHA